jgi:hypothetical protein
MCFGDDDKIKQRGVKNEESNIICYGSCSCIIGIYRL